MPRRLYLFDLFPALSAIPHADLGVVPSPVEEVYDAQGTPALWLKRDDRNAPVMAGNKVRALEFLLGEVEPGNRLLTVGGEGSTHVLSTAVHASRLGASTRAIRWRHEMNPMAHVVARHAETACAQCETVSTIASAFARAGYARARAQDTLRWIPFGGSSPLGMLGHIEGALELARQVETGELPEPGTLVIPFGTGGTVAGLAVGMAMAGLKTRVVGVRVGPRIGVNRARVWWLMRALGAFLRSYDPGIRLPFDRVAFDVWHDAYGGAYGRPLTGAAEATAALAAISGVTLDATYSTKACFAALQLARRSSMPVLYWLTFDARTLVDEAAREDVTPMPNVNDP